MEAIWINGCFALAGALPTSLGDLYESMKWIRISGTSVTGVIPEEVGNLLHLETFNVRDNQLNGTIPESFSNLNKLADLQVYNNDLTGKIPHLSSTLTTCFLVWGNSFTCHHSDNTICGAEGLVGLVFCY